MSYELAFWRGGDDLDPSATYLAFSEEREIEGVATVVAADVEAALAHRLSGWTRSSNILQPPGADPDGAPAFDVFVGRQHVSFTGYGIEEADHMNAIITVMHDIGMRLYDPQTDERFG